ncbi:hypothetical protein EV702DRAFT_1048750 [Suillus placidus]|uniref:Uncharacterized protein n=1 Tax=Suillus placidus TaxID=48579 RepID=A0A9P6ZMP9_9AGAM|nr:hypothetical protein EV702DRAFT_1048750 [Suillus placidus]
MPTSRPQLNNFQGLLHVLSVRFTSETASSAELENPLTANPGTTRRVGLYKVTEDAVQTVIGGVYHQFVEGVPAEFHQKALVLCECMGGVDGNLLVQEPVSDLEAVETVQPKTTVVNCETNPCHLRFQRKFVGGRYKP